MQKLTQFELDDIVCRYQGSWLDSECNIPHVIGYSEHLAWGYAGTGPSDLSLNILYHFSKGDREFAHVYCHDFTMDFINDMPDKGGTIKKEEILHWMENKKITGPVYWRYGLK